MALQLEPRDHPYQVTVVTESHDLLTDALRLEDLYNRGYKFEAAAAQSLIIEALASMYLLIHRQAHARPILDRRGNEVELTSNATFGRVVSLIGFSRAYHSEGLKEDLEKYVELRNDLIHEMSGSTISLDLDEFFALGKRVTEIMKPHFVKTIGYIEKSRTARQ